MGFKPLSSYREIKLLNFYMRLYANPNHPMYDTLVDGNDIEAPIDIQEAPAFFNNVRNSILNRGKFLRRHNNIELKYTIQESPSPSLTPPWSLPNIIVCGEILEYRKQDFTPDQLKNIFCNRLWHHANSYKIFTDDGSKTDDGVGFAAVREHWKLAHKIQTFAAVFTEELCVLRASIERCRDTHAPSITLITDSRSSIEALVEYNISNSLVQSIQLELATLNKLVYFCWVPSHIGVRGNEDTDTTARSIISTLRITPYSTTN